MHGSVYTERQHQLCDDASDTALIENNEVAPKWIATLIWSNSIVVNQDSIASVIPALMLTWALNPAGV